MTFSANHVDELISASLTGDLTDAERAEMDAHLARCEKCRATLAAFKSERRILAALPPADPPRDLSARVRAGIESGQTGGPWWRRPIGLVAIGASTMTVAAVVLGLVVLNNRPSPVGQASGSPEATLSLAPSASVAESAPPSAVPSTPATFLAPGQLGYFELSGGSLEPSKLSFINDATGASIDAGVVSGPPIAASLSPDAEWLAYITQKGETGAHEVWALHITDGTVTPLGCSLDAPFTDRLAWSPDSRYVAFTLVAIDLGPDSGCPDIDGALGGTDAWIFEAPTGGRGNMTLTGNAFAGSFVAGSVVGTAEPRLLVSWAAERPWTGALLPDSDATFDRIDDVFLPLVSPDGNRAIFWNGTMAQGPDGVWQFSLGGLPHLSGDFRSTGPASPWVGTPLFTDLIAYGGEAFAHGKYAWGPDSDQFAFWDGAWTGVPQSADGKYPSQQDVYTGRVVGGGQLSKSSRAGIDLPDGAWIVDVALSGTEMAVTIGLPSAGIGDPPSAYVQIFRDEGGVPRIIGGGVNPRPWDGPVVYGH